MDLARQLESIDHDGHRLAEAVRANPDGRGVSCPDWSGADLLAHVSGFARYLTDLMTGHADRDTAFPKVPPREAAQTYDADLARLVTTLRDTPPDTEVPHWAAVQQVAAWQRRAVHELAADLMLALWRRRDPLAFHVDGPRGMLERWPSI